MEREKLGSRLGFILLSAGCAIGIGNVWRFPYVAGNSGGGFFCIHLFVFLAIMGLPIMTMEFAVGRASQKSAVRSYQVLEKPGQKWHLHGWLAMAGNYLLMMFYTTVSGWMLHYFYMEVRGGFSGKDSKGVTQVFYEMLESPETMTFWMVVVVILGFLSAHRGCRMVWSNYKVHDVGFACNYGSSCSPQCYTSGCFRRACFLSASELEQDAGNRCGKCNCIGYESGIFTLSLGIGAMAIFGSYIGKSRSLFGESINVAVLDTFVAITAGLIIFPACFAYGVKPDSGPGLIFMTLPNIFNEMPGGRLWEVCSLHLCLLRHFPQFLQCLRILCPLVWICGDGAEGKQQLLILL